MDTEGVPKRIDKSYLNKLAGSMQGQVFSALRALDLMDADKQPTAVLRSLVSDGDNRPAHWKEIIERNYGWAVVLGTDATHQQLSEAFRDNAPKLSATTRDRAMAFYLQAAAYAGIPLSKFFHGGVGSVAGGTRPPRRVRQPRVRATPAETPPKTDPLPSSGSHRDAFINLLLKKAEEAKGKEAESLYDRITALLAEKGGESK
ncbi:MAG TPA: hypothetical protein VND54_10125 [Candidatus Saccharimonadales bacterium]|nr:hypothetical protein [Candidatus Saccharimonadales bacterium]HVC42321.1 hypothetical protein [Candidatus Saccharimonadales bacterium]